MNDQNQGINAPRQGIQESLAAPGVNPRLPAKPDPIGDAMQSLLGQTANTLETGLRVAEVSDIRRAMEAESTNKPVPSMLTKKGIDFAFERRAALDMSAMSDADWQAEADRKNTEAPGMGMPEFIQQRLDVRAANAPAAYRNYLRDAYTKNITAVLDKRNADAKAAHFEDGLAALVAMPVSMESVANKHQLLIEAEQAGIPKSKFLTNYYSRKMGVLKQQGTQEALEQARLVERMAKDDGMEPAVAGAIDAVRQAYGVRLADAAEGVLRSGADTALSFYKNVASNPDITERARTSIMENMQREFKRFALADTRHTWRGEVEKDVTMGRIAYGSDLSFDVEGEKHTLKYDETVKQIFSDVWQQSKSDADAKFPVTPQSPFSERLKNMQAALDPVITLSTRNNYVVPEIKAFLGMGDNGILNAAAHTNTQVAPQTQDAVAMYMRLKDFDPRLASLYVTPDQAARFDTIVKLVKTNGSIAAAVDTVATRQATLAQDKESEQRIRTTLGNDYAPDAQEWLVAEAMNYARAGNSVDDAVASAMKEWKNRTVTLDGRTTMLDEKLPAVPSNDTLDELKRSYLATHPKEQTTMGQMAFRYDNGNLILQKENSVGSWSDVFDQTENKGKFSVPLVLRMDEQRKDTIAENQVYRLPPPDALAADTDLLRDINRSIEQGQYWQAWKYSRKMDWRNLVRTKQVVESVILWAEED